jgi:hypothetical protein
MDADESMLGRMNQALTVIIGALMFAVVCVVGFQYGPQAGKWIKDLRKPHEFQSPQITISGFDSSQVPTAYTEFHPVNIQPISEDRMREINNIMSQNMARDAVRQSQQRAYQAQHGSRP